VRRLESQLTQQKVSYDRQIKELTQAASVSAESAPSTLKPLGPEQAICTLEVEKLADQLNGEVSSLALMTAGDSAAPPYDWKIINLVQLAGKQMSETIERVLISCGDSSAELNETRKVFKKLDTRLHLCTGQLYKHLTEQMRSNRGYD